MSKRTNIPPPDPDHLDPAAAELKHTVSRRRFLKGVGATVAVLGTGGIYSWRIEPHWIEVVRRDLPIANLPDKLVGRTLALLSDLHVGPVVDGDYIRSAMRRVSSLNPDLIAITGDFMSCLRNEYINEVMDVLSHLKTPPRGIFVVLGNHDYGKHWSQPTVAEELVRRLRERNIRVLRNELAWLDRLQIVGLDDLWAAARHDCSLAFDPERVMPSVDKGSAAIVLLHNPDGVDQPGWSGYSGWVLCGHTHGGQVDLPLLGPPELPVHNKRYVRGEYDVGQGRRMYINRGLGYLRRVRLNSRPEITLFTLRG